MVPTRAALCAVLLLLVGGAAPSLAAPSATLTATTTVFGDRQVGAGPSATKAYTLRNTGTEALSVGSASTTSGSAFAVATDNCAGKTLTTTGTAASCTILATFAPTATGAQSATLTTTAGTLTPTAAMSGRGRDLRGSPALLDLGRTRAGTPTAEGTLTLRNADTADYALGAVTVSNTSAFTITDNGCANTTVPAGQSCTVKVRGSVAEPAVATGTLAVAGLTPAPASLRVEATQPVGFLTPVTASWGRSTGTRTFTVQNTADEPLEVAAPTTTGPDAAAFGVSTQTCTAAPVALGGTCSITVVFTPGGPGYRTADLVVPTNAAGPALRARLDAVAPGAGLGTDPLATPFDLATQPLARLDGDGGDFHGQGLTSGACDVDGDGYDDLLSGAPTWSRFPVSLSREGAAYVTFGGPSVGSRDLAAAGPATRTLRIEGAGPSSSAGLGIACAGDVNGDGIDDVLLGSWSYEYPGRPSGTAASRGEAHVVFGARDLGSTSPIDTGLLGTRGFTLVAPDVSDADHLAVAVAGVGDLNADGKDDIALLANTATVTGTTNRGVTYVVAGRASSATVDVTQDQLMHLNGGPPGPTGTTSTSGQALDVAGVGDVDGDGTPDIGVGQYTAVFNGRSTASGAAWVVSGAKRGTVDLGTPSQSLMVIGGAGAGHRLGTAIDTAGDVNGDGVDDVLVGADATASATSDAAYVIYGKRGGAGETLDTASLGARGYRILGDPGDGAGFGVSPAGDVDGDGLDDVAIGRQSAGTAGAVSIVHGVADPTTLPANAAGSGLSPANPSDTTRYVRLSTLTPAQGSTLVGTTAGERLGRQVALVGDVDANGTQDLAIGADQALRFGRTGAGEVSLALLRGPRPVLPPEPVDPTPPGPSPTDPTPPGPTPTDPTPTPASPAESLSPPAETPPGKAADPEPGPSGPVRPVDVVRPRVDQPSVRADRSGALRFVVRCPVGVVTCEGTARLRLGNRRSSTATWKVLAGQQGAIRLRLSLAQRRALKPGRTRTARLELQLSRPDGPLVPLTLAVKVRRA